MKDVLRYQPGVGFYGDNQFFTQNAKEIADKAEFSQYLQGCPASLFANRSLAMLTEDLCGLSEFSRFGCPYKSVRSLLDIPQGVLLYEGSRQGTHYEIPFKRINSTSRIAAKDTNQLIAAIQAKNTPFHSAAANVVEIAHSLYLEEVMKRL